MRIDKEKSSIITFNIQNELLKLADVLVTHKLYNSRSSLIRVAIFDLIVKNLGFVDFLAGKSNDEIFKAIDDTLLKTYKNDKKIDKNNDKDLDLRSSLWKNIVDEKLKVMKQRIGIDENVENDE